MSHLNPVLRPDKNGKMVTRHVRPSSQERKPAPKLPAPEPVAKETSRYFNLKNLTNGVCRQMGFELHNSNEWYDINIALDSYSDDLLDRLAAAFKPRTQIASAIGLMVYHGESEAFVREFAKFGGMVPDETTGMHMTISFIRALHMYPQLPQVEDYSTADEKTQEACRGLIQLSLRLRDERNRFDSDNQPITTHDHDYDNYMTLTVASSELVQLVIDRPEDAGRIADIAVDRATTDAKAIASVLDYDTKSLSSGVL